MNNYEHIEGKNIVNSCGTCGEDLNYVKVIVSYKQESPEHQKQ